MIPTVVMLFIVVAAAGAYGIVYFHLKSQLETFADRARAAGFPASAKELNTFYDFGPEAEQAGRDLSSLLERIANAPQSEEVISVTPASYTLGETIPAAVLDSSRRYLALHESVLEELRARLRGLPHVRYPTDLSLGAAAPLDHLARIRAGTRLLSLDAVLAAIDGDTARAERSLRQAFALAETLRDEPVLISQLVRTACHGIAVRGLE